MKLSYIETILIRVSEFIGNKDFDGAKLYVDKESKHLTVDEIKFLISFIESKILIKSEDC